MSRLDPIFYVTVFPASADGGGQVDGTKDVTQLEYLDDEQKEDKVTLTVDNYGLHNFHTPVWKTGNRIEVAWGFQGNLANPRTAIIQKVTGGPVLKVEAKDPSCLMNRTMKMRTFERMRRSDVVRQIARENGYGAEAVHIDETPVVQEQVTQARMTDLQMIRSLARREGFEFYIDFDGLHWHARRLGMRPLRRLVYFNPPNEGDILTWNLENDIYDGKAGGVTMAGIDPLTKEKVNVTADNSTSAGSTALAPQKIIITGIDRRDGHVTGDTVKETGTQAIVRTTQPSPTAENTKPLAQQTYNKNQMTAAELTLETVGDPRMIAKVVIEVAGIGKALSGNYFVKSVTHKVSSGGYVSTVKAKRDGATSHDNTVDYERAIGVGVGSGGAGAGVGVVAPKGPVNAEPAKPPAPEREVVTVEKIDPRTGVATRTFVYRDVPPDRQQVTPPTPSTGTP